MDFLQFLPAVGQAIGSIFSAKSAKETNQSNAAQAQQQMDFQERMSNTAHQREVKDLEAAGLNPILSANAGASTPGGAMASFKNPLENLPNEVNSAASLALNTQATKAQLATAKTQQAANSAAAMNSTAQARLTNANAVIAEANSAKAAAEGNVYKGWFGKALSYVSETLGAVGNVFHGSGSISSSTVSKG